MRDPSPRFQRLHRRIIDQLGDLRLRCTGEVLALAVPSISAWSVGQHVEHLMLADDAIVGRLEDLDLEREPARRAGHPRAIGRLVLWTGWLRRGRGRAPRFAIPADPTAVELVARIEATRRRVEGLGPRLGQLEVSRHTSAHPALGELSASEWLRFIAIHDWHHLKIIRAIERATAR